MRVAVVGCGSVAEQHLAAIRRIRCDPVAVCDIDGGRAEQFGRRFAISGVFTDLQRMLGEARPEVVHVLTPPRSHVDLAARALAAGCHVLVEKPLAATTVDAERLAGLEASSSGTVSVCHNFLYVPAVAKALAAARAGRYGEIEFGEVYWRITSIPGETRRGLDAWLQDLPGGIFGEVGPHPIYLLQQFLGRLDVVAVEYLPSAGRSSGRYEGRVAVLFRAGNSLASLTMSTTAAPIRKTMRLTGTRRGLDIDLGTSVSVEHRFEGRAIGSRAMQNIDAAYQLLEDTALNAAKTLARRMPRSHELFLRDYYSALSSGLPPPVSVGDGVAVVRVLDQVCTRLAACVP